MENLELFYILNSPSGSRYLGIQIEYLELIFGSRKAERTSLKRNEVIEVLYFCAEIK